MVVVVELMLLLWLRVRKSESGGETRSWRAHQHVSAATGSLLVQVETHPVQGHCTQRKGQRRRGSEQLGNRAQWSAAVIRDEGTIRDSNIIYHYTLHSILHSGAYGTCVHSANIPDHKHKFLEINLSRKVFIKI